MSRTKIVRRPDQTEFLDERQLCAKLGISPLTAQDWRRYNRGPSYIKVGRLVRYRTADVEAWLAANTRGANVG